MQAQSHMTNTPKHPTHLLYLAAVLLAFALSFQSPAAPQPSPDNHIQAALHAPGPIIIGKPNILALTLNIDDRWHTYWPGINDTGYGISLKFAPVDGLTFGDPVFPTPTRQLAPGNILDHIYENQITIYIPVEADDSITPSDQLTINTTIDYLICKDLCIPESITTTVTLQAANPEPQSADEPKTLTDLEARYYIYRPMHLNNTVDIPHTSDHTPITTTAEGVTSLTPDPRINVWYTADNQWQENKIRLTIPGATHYTFFPDNNCTNPADLIAQGDTESKTLTITFGRRYEDDPTTPARLSGRLLAKFKHGWREFDIDYIQPQPKETTP